MSGIIPTPTRLHTDQGGYAFPPSVRIAGSVDAVAASAAEAAARITALTAHQVAVAPDTSDAEVSLHLADVDGYFVDVADPAGVGPSQRDPRDERYVLAIDTSGVQIRAAAAEGLARGLASLTQLMVTSGGGDVTLDHQQIVDSPRFAWRGLSFDVVRTFFGPSEVKTVIDMLALHKMNVLHLHLTDDQGWRLEIPPLPRLTEVAAAGAVGDRPGGYYSTEEFADIVEYAAERFVTVVPEIDVPGHTSAIFAAYPELHPSGDDVKYLDPRLPETREFLTTVFEHLASVSPGEYIHVGGDEAFGMPEELYQEFVSLALPLVRATGKKVIGWQEISRGDLTTSDVIQYWIHGTGDLAESLSSMGPEFDLGPEMIAAIVEQFKHAEFDLPKAQGMGARVLLSPTSVCYLDTPYAEPSRDADQEARRATLGLSFYAPRSVPDSVDWTPSTVVEGIDMTGVVGIEAAIWCETVVTPADLHLLLLPRLAGLAEKAWSVEAPTVWEEYGVRLAAQAPLWRQAGWHFFESTLVDWK